MEKVIPTPSVQTKGQRFWRALVWPYRSFKSIFHQSSKPRKSLLVANCILPGLGDLLLGEIELGLGYITSVALYLFYMISVGWKHLFGLVQVDYANLTLLAILLTLIFLVVVHFAFNSTVKKVDFLNQQKTLRGSYVFNFFKSIVKKFKTYFQQVGKVYATCDRTHKKRMTLSFFLMGVDELMDKQLFKGILFLVSQIGYFLYMILAGGGHIVGLFTLKVAQQVSTATMVYGILAMFLTLFYLFLYILHLQAVLRNAQLRMDQKEIPTFKQEWQEASNRKFYWISLSIPVLGAVAFTVLPLTFMILIAFTDFGTSGTIPIMNTRWISWTFLDSFVQLFGLAENFKTLVKVFQWTMVWALLATFTCYFGGFFLAMLLAKKSVKGKIIYRSLFVVAMAVPQFVTLRVMNTMFNEYGPINTILMNWGLIDARIAFWDNIVWAKVLIVLVNMWVGIPYYMLLISGLLLNIPKDYYEAASIEGASKRQQFAKITFPHIFFMTTPLLITSFVSNINNFNVIWLLTGGAPLGQGTGGVAGGTDILITWLYKLTMQNNPEYNLGAAIGIVMFIISAIISLLIFRNSASYKKEEEFRQ